jgi:sulfopropanediol 3-dehydrogenase
MIEYLKQAPWHSRAASEDVKRTVSEMLSRIDADPEAEIRRYSRELDGWEPDSFLVGEAEIAAAGEPSMTSCESTSRSPRRRCAASPRHSAPP